MGHVQVSGQSRAYHISFSNNVTSLPVTGYPQLFYANFHPGLDFQYNKKINPSETNRLFLAYQGGVIYHRYVQTLVSLSGNVMYERPLGNRVSVDVALGAGYGAAFNNEAVAKLNSNGVYEVKPSLVPRSQFLIRFQPGVTYALRGGDPAGARISAHFRTMLQGLFVNNYVPLLPINSFMLGIVLPIDHAKS